MTDFIQRLISRAVEPVEVLLPRPASLFEPVTGSVPSGFGPGDSGGGWMGSGETGWVSGDPGSAGNPGSMPVLLGNERVGAPVTRTSGRSSASEVAVAAAPGSGYPRGGGPSSAQARPPVSLPSAALPGPEIPAPPPHARAAEATDRLSPAVVPPAPDRFGADPRIGDDGASRQRANDLDDRPTGPMLAPPIVRETIIREVPADERRVRRGGPIDGREATLPEIIRRMVLQPVRREEVRERVVERVPGPAAALDRVEPDPAPRVGQGPRDDRAALEMPRLEPAVRRRAEPPPALTPRAERLSVLDAPSPPSAAPPTIHVRIGRIEVRATPEGAAVPVPPPPSTRPAVMTLDEYLAASARRGR